jgi:uncharacterized protein YkwD
MRFRRPATLLLLAALGGCAGGEIAGDLTGVPAMRQVPVDPREAAAILTALRAEHDLPAVAVSPALNAIAQDYADVLAAAGEVGHRVGGTLASRLQAGGYVFSVAGENLGGGYRSVEEAFDLWAASPSHRANLLAEPITEIGIATAFNAASPYRTFWVLLVGRPQ